MWSWFSNTRGGSGVGMVCAACTVVAFVAVGSQWVAVAIDKSGQTLCKSVPTSATSVNMTGAQRCDATELGRAANTRYQADRNTSMPRGGTILGAHAWEPGYNLQDQANAYQQGLVFSDYLKLKAQGVANPMPAATPSIMSPWSILDKDINAAGRQLENAVPGQGGR